LFSNELVLNGKRKRLVKLVRLE